MSSPPAYRRGTGVESAVGGVVWARPERGASWRGAFCLGVARGWPGSGGRVIVGRQITRQGGGVDVVLDEVEDSDSLPLGRDGVDGLDDEERDEDFACLGSGIGLVGITPVA